MSLTKQHFIALTRIIKTSENKQDIIENLIPYFKTQNKNFNTEMFRDAVKE